MDWKNDSATKLSGGQQQRLALARALVRQPKLLLLDEPLSNLDAALREHMRVELRQMQQRLGLTTIYVTHDQLEALALSDIIAVMHEGVIEQLGTPQEIYQKPTNRFIAGFIGNTNWLEGKVLDVEAGGKMVNVETSVGIVSSLMTTPAKRRQGHAVHSSGGHPGGYGCPARAALLRGPGRKRHVSGGIYRLLPAYRGTKPEGQDASATTDASGGSGLRADFGRLLCGAVFMRNPAWIWHAGDVETQRTMSEAILKRIREGRYPAGIRQMRQAKYIVPSGTQNAIP